MGTRVGRNAGLRYRSLLIQWDRRQDRVYMTGPAKVVFDGVWPDA